MLPTLVTLIALWLIVLRQPDTPIARAVWRLTVIVPIGWASRVQRRQFLLALTFSVVALIVFYWIGHEGPQLLAMGAPDIAAWWVTFEVGTYIDALTAVAVVASSMRAKEAWTKAVNWVSMRVPLPIKRQPKTRRRHAQRAGESRQ